jgi:hypothetical protein
LCQHSWSIKNLTINSFIIEQIDLDMWGKTEGGKSRGDPKKLSIMCKTFFASEEVIWYGTGYLEWDFCSNENSKHKQDLPYN